MSRTLLNFVCYQDSGLIISTGAVPVSKGDEGICLFFFTWNKSLDSVAFSSRVNGIPDTIWAGKV